MVIEQPYASTRLNPSSHRKQQRNLIINICTRQEIVWRSIIHPRVTPGAPAIKPPAQRTASHYGLIENPTRIQGFGITKPIRNYESKIKGATGTIHQNPGKTWGSRE